MSSNTRKLKMVDRRTPAVTEFNAASPGHQCEECAASVPERSDNIDGSDLIWCWLTHRPLMHRKSHGCLEFTPRVEETK